MAQKAAQALQGVTQAQDDHTRASERATQAQNTQSRSLQQLVEAHTREKKGAKDTAAAIRELVSERQRDIAATKEELKQLESEIRTERAAAQERSKQSVERISQLRAEAAEHERAMGSSDEYSKSLKREAAALETASRQEASAHTRNVSTINKSIAASRNHVDALGREARELENMARDVESSGSRFSRFFENIRSGARDADVNLSKLSSSFRGFQIAFVIKYAQALASALIALGTTLLNVASSAVQAGVGLGAALAGGAAQALPVVGALVGAFARVVDVLKIVKLQQQNQTNSTHAATTAASQQAAATDRVRNAQQALADAHTRVADAQRNAEQADKRVTQARRDLNLAYVQGKRDVEDLMAAEDEARRRAEGAALSLEDAKRALSTAVRTGDVASIGQAQLDVEDARAGVTDASTQQSRATQDANRARRTGVGGTDVVRNARQALSSAQNSAGDAHRSVTQAQTEEKRAVQDLTEARKKDTDAMDDQTSAQDRLKDMLAQLTPAERGLYNAIIRMQKVYRDNFRPITDIIVGAFTRAVDHVTTLLGDPRIIAGFKRVAQGVSDAIDQITHHASSSTNINVFTFLTREAVRNMPIVVRILENVFDAARNFVVAAAPAFHLLLDFAEGYSKHLKSASDNQSGMSKFFVTGVRYLKQWVDLGLAVIGLFAALTGAGGARQGTKAIADMTGEVHKATDWINSHQRAVRNFFKEAYNATKDVMSIVIAIGKELLRAFSGGSVHAFAQFLTQVVIPAIGNTVEIMGQITRVAHQILSLPFVSQIAQWTLTFIMAGRGVMILVSAGKALKEMFAGIAAATEEGGLGVWGAVILGVVAAVIVLDRHFHFLAPTLKWLQGIFDGVWTWIKKAADDVASYFSDVWNKGILYWMRYPFVQFAKWIAPYLSDVWDVIKKVVDVLINFFSGKGQFGAVGDLISMPFRTGFKVIKLVWELIRAVVKGTLEFMRGDIKDAGHTFTKAFSDIWDGIKGIFSGNIKTVLRVLGGAFDLMKGVIRGAKNGIVGAFNFIWDGVMDGLNAIIKAMYSVVTTVLNGIVGAVNAVIGAFNKLPGPNIGKVDFHLPTWDQLQTLNKAESGQKTSNYAGPHATGGMLRARNGGSLITVAEGGHDELVLTTDPKYSSRSKGLLEEYLKRMAPHFAAGGFVAEPGTNFSFGEEPQIVKALKRLAELLHVTVYGISGYRSPQHSAAVGGFSNDPHTQGRAADIGINSALRASMFAVPERILRQVGLYRPFYPPDANEVNHVQLLSDRLGDIAHQIGQALGGNVTAAAGLVAQLPKELTKSVEKILGKNPGGHKGGIFSGALGTTYEAASRAIRGIQDKAATLGNGVGGPVGSGVAAPPGQVRTWVERALRLTGHYSPANVRALYGRVMFESSGNPDAINLTDINAQEGHPSKGLGQTIDSTFQTYRLKSLPNDIYNPIANLVASIRYMFARYGHIMGVTGQGYALGGPVGKGYGGGDRLAALLEAGEHVWTKDEVRAAGGHNAMYAMRRAFGGGGQGSDGRYQDGGSVALTAARGLGRDALSALASVLDGISSLKPGRLLARIRVGFNNLLADGGLLDQMGTQIDNIATLGQQHLQERTYRITGRRGGGYNVSRAGVSDAQTAQANLTTLGQTRTGLLDQQSTIADGLQIANRAVAEAERRIASARTAAGKAAARKVLQQAQGEVNALNQRSDTNAQALAQNAQDMVEAQETFQQALHDAVTKRADKDASNLDRWQRTLVALGRTADPADVARAQIASFTRERSGLQSVLAQAVRTGNKTLADSTRDEIDELTTQIAEAGAQIFQAQIDAINQNASDALTSNDLLQRRAQVGTTNYAALGNALVARGQILASQRAGLAGALQTAYANNDIDHIKTLTASIDSLDADIADNTQAIQDNTDAAFGSRVDQINSTFDFLGGALDSATTFFQSLGDITGNPMTSTLLGLANTKGAALGTQRTGLLGSLADLLGYQGSERSGLLGLQGSDLVNMLLSLSQGPVYDSIMGRLDNTQQGQFQSLISALLSNASAVNDNTKSINDLNGLANTQDWSSPQWLAYRLAIFNGSGGLLPSYSVPGLASPSLSAATSAGSTPTIIPASASSGPQTSLTVNQVKERFDPLDAATTLSFIQKNMR